jgi:hypothetical protein
VKGWGGWSRSVAIALLSLTLANISCSLLDPRASSTATPSWQPTPLGVVPTFTPLPPSPAPPSPTDTPPPPSPTDTPAPPPTAEVFTPSPLPPPATDTPLPPPADAPLPPPSATPPPQPPLAPQQGGSWDMEEGFVLRKPLPFPPGEGDVAVGWEAFGRPGQFGPAKFNGNKNLANVHAGQLSQEMTFDYVDAMAGIFRQAQTIAGHRYKVAAWGKHIASPTPVVLELGIDSTGGVDPWAGTVQWTPWDEAAETEWVYAEEVVQASGPAITIFLKAHHPQAVGGGATLFDDVSVTDLGP